MPATAFVERLNDQIANEFGAHQQYVAIAVHYDAETLPRLAAFFYAQALEERNHAMMMVQYLMDAGVEPVDPRRRGAAHVLRRHRRAGRVGARAGAPRLRPDRGLAKVAREEGDYLSEQFTLWFLKEQVEEVATMSDLLRVVERARENPMFAEDYLAREHPGEEGADPTAPPAAGGAL